MERVKLLLLGLVKLTPSKSFLLGTGLILLMPESLYSSLALTYHDIVHDNTYILEDSVRSINKPPALPSNPEPPQQHLQSPETKPK